MRRNIRQWFVRMKLLLFFHRPPHLILNMQRYFGLIIFIQKQKATVPVYYDFRLHLFLDFFLLFPQFLQIRGVHRLPFPSNVCIAILINQIFSLALSCSQDSSLMIFAFLGHCQTPFRDGKNLDMTHLLYHIEAVFYITNFR